MAFQNSPGVNVSEVDLTGIVVASGSSIGAIAGSFQWGPVAEIRTIANESVLVNTFGKPDNDTAVTFFSAANFLGYAGSLKVVRAIGSTAFNATSGATGILVENETDYTANHATGATGVPTWFAKYPGTIGNSLKVSMTDGAKFAAWAYNTDFDSAPNTSTYASNIFSGSNDEMHVVVVDEDGVITGTAGTVLEKYAFVSKASDAKTQSGESNYYKTVINRKSQWIWWGNHHTGATGPGAAWGSAVSGSTGFASFGATGPIYQSLSAGFSDNVLSSAEEIIGYDMFKDENVDVNLIISGGALSATNIDLIGNLAEARKDVVLFVSPGQTDVVDNAGQEAADISTARAAYNSSSFTVMDSGWKYQYDKYNDIFRWIPLNADIAGLCARTDQTNDPWFSPAGYNRGSIKNVIKLAYNPSKADRDTLYKAGVNSVVTFPGQGTILFGDKTMLAKPSAFDRINVRRLFIVLEKAISTASKFSLFELNDSFTRAQFVAMVEPFLRDVKGRRGITDFRVVCDETNNTGEVIDSNSFVGDIYIKPSRSINYIQLNFVAVRTGVEFNTIVGGF